MKSKKISSRSGSLSATVHYVCQACKNSFRSIDQFLSHKARRHPREFRNHQHIVFEEKSIEIGADSTGHLHPPFVMLKKLAFDPVTGSMASNSHQNQNKNVLKTSNRSTTSPSSGSAPHLQNPSRVEETEPEPEQSKPDCVSLSSMNLELFDDDAYGLTDAEMYRFISNDEIVDLPNPYIRINQLTPKQLEIKAQAFPSNLTSRKRPALTSKPFGNKKAGRKSQKSVSKYTRIMPMPMSESGIDGSESDSDSGSDINFSRKKSRARKSSSTIRKRKIAKKFLNYNESDDSSTSVSSAVVKKKSKRFKSRFEKEVEIISDDSDSSYSDSDGWGKKSDGEREYAPPKWLAAREKREKKSSTGSKFVRVANKKKTQAKPKTKASRKREALYRNLKKIIQGD